MFRKCTIEQINNVICDLSFHITVFYDILLIVHYFHVQVSVDFMHWPMPFIL